MHYPSLILGGALLISSLGSIQAQTKAAADSTKSTPVAAKTAPERPQQVVGSILYYGPVCLHQPLMVDSVNINNARYNPQAASSGRLILPEEKSFSTLSPGEGNIFTTSVDSLTDAKMSEAHYYNLYLHSGTYSKGRLSVECTATWELYLDGRRVGGGRAAAGIADSIPVAWSPVTLTPSLHKLTIKILRAAQPDQKKQIDLRVGFTPSKAGADILLSAAPRRYPDQSLILYGTTLSRVNSSPSGKYAILHISEHANMKPTSKTILYHSGRRVGEISGAPAHAQWMPRQDKLYFDQWTSEGRTLYSFDPKTMEREILGHNIPDGTYTLAPDEQTLIYFPSEQGPQYKKTLDRFTSADERMRGFRSRNFLATFDLKSGAYQTLTFGARSTHLQSLAQGVDRLIYSVSTPTPTQLPFSRTDFYELDLKTQQVDTLFADTRGISQVSYTTRPEYLLVSGSADAFDRVGCVLPDGADINTYDTQLFLYNRKSKEARPLTKDFNPTIGSLSVSSTRFEAYFLAEDGDRKAVYRLDLASGRITRLSQSEDYAKGFTLSGDGSMLYYTGQSALNSDRLYSVETKKGREHLLYDLSAEKLKGVELGTMKDWDWTAPDGTKIQGRYYLPANFDPNKKYPMLVYYYGGTAPVGRMLEGSYSLAMYAAQGYVVYTLNPSGSTGYGQEFAARHINAWGKRTADEIIGAVKDFCQAHPFVNDKRIGCMGASYGGFMTQYLQTQTDLFAAAVSHAGISAISSYWGEGYWGVGYSTVASKNSYPWNNPKLYTEQSPLFLADKINTPLMLVHGLSDTNVPAGESWQMFNALRILGKPVEFVGVYGEDHWIIDPTKKYEWTSAIMAFFAKYLQDDPTWWDDLFPKGTH